MDKYYFVSYRWKKVRDGSLYWNYSNTLITKHPLLWLCDMKLIGDDSEIYQIDFYEEIDKDVYDLTYLQLEE